MSKTDTRVEQLLAANVEVAKNWVTPPKMELIREGDASVACLTCMDPRAVPEQFLGPNPRIAVWRNAGGRFSADVVRTAAVFRSLVPKAEKPVVLVVHHTDCGMTHLTNEEIRQDIRNKGLGNDEDLANIDFGCFAAEDLEKTIKDDIAKFEAEDILKGIEFRGYVLVTETGELKAVQ